LLRDLSAWSWRLLVVAAAGWLLLRIVETFGLVFLPLVASLLLVALLSPVTDWLCRHRIPRVVATVFVVVLSLALLGAAITWVVQQVINQAPTLVEQLSRTVAGLHLPSDTLTSLQGHVVQELESHRESLAKGALSGLATGAEVLTGALLTVLFTLILLADGRRMWRWIVAGLPPRARTQVDEAAERAFGRLSGWIRGTILIAAFHTVVVAVTLLLLGVPLVAPLAVLVFFGSFIPLLGVLLAGGIAVLVAFATAGLTGAIVLVVVLFVSDQIEAHVLQPFLVGRYVRLHPFVVAVVITVGAVLASLPGALVAVPLTAAAYAAIQRIEGVPARRRPPPVDPDPPDPEPDGGPR
jgi:predicted PurR-regulated permease PerM